MIRGEAKRTKVVVLTVSLLVMLSGIAYSAPDWRGDAQTTFEQWSFSSWNYGPVAPDAGANNPYGAPYLVVNSSSQWNSAVGQHTGVWTLSGEMDAIIPNYPEVGGQKEIWIELTWKGAGLSFLPDSPLIGVETDTGYDRMEINRQDTSIGDGWKTSLYKIYIWPNPTWEWIAIKGDIYVDKVVVDTYCGVPEPCTVALLGLGAIIVMKKRNQKKS